MPEAVEKERKFMFDLNIFDDRYVEEPEAAPPPPPTFSEAEMEAARKDAFERGRQQGLKESAESREQFVARQMEKIVGTLPGLQQAEKKREALYERESLALTLALLSRLFPALNDRFGFDEAKAVIAEVLQGQSGQSEIVIEVPEDMADGVRGHVGGALPRLSQVKVEVVGSPALGPGACRVFWKDGGALRDARAMAEDITARIEGLLAESPINGQNEDRIPKDGTERGGGP